ncbi:MAG: hypothetical protein VW405_10905 [Rhodospirillaceae bacterium]
MPDWPRQLLITVTFVDGGDITDVRLTWTLQEATDAEIACFTAAVQGFGMGWGAGFDIIAEILAKMAD